MTTKKTKKQKNSPLPLDNELPLNARPATVSNIANMLQECCKYPMAAVYGDQELILDGPWHKLKFTLDYDNGDFCYLYSDTSYGTLPILPNYTVKEYFEKYSDIIHNMIHYLDTPGLIKEDIVRHAVDWNKWHDVVDNALSAFSFDDAADVCQKLGLVDEDIEDDPFPIQPGSLYQNTSDIMTVLIKLYELNWAGNTIFTDENSEPAYGYKIYGNCIAEKDDTGTICARLKFKQTTSHFLSDPHLEIRLYKDKDGNMCFRIDLIIIEQFW